MNLSMKSVYISLFWVRNNILLHIILNMAQKKPASSAGVDSACKNKHMPLSMTQKWNCGRHCTKTYQHFQLRLFNSLLLFIKMNLNYLFFKVLIFLCFLSFLTNSSVLKLCNALKLYFMKSCVSCFDTIIC